MNHRLLPLVFLCLLFLATAAKAKLSSTEIIVKNFCEFENTKTQNKIVGFVRGSIEKQIHKIRIINPILSDKIKENIQSREIHIFCVPADNFLAFSDPSSEHISISIGTAKLLLANALNDIYLPGSLEISKLDQILFHEFLHYTIAEERITPHYGKDHSIYSSSLAHRDAIIACSNYSSDISMGYIGEIAVNPFIVFENQRLQELERNPTVGRFNNELYPANWIEGEITDQKKIESYNWVSSQVFTDRQCRTCFNLYRNKKQIFQERERFCQKNSVRLLDLEKSLKQIPMLPKEL